MAIDLSKTLEELENENWGEPEYDSYLVKTVHQLRKKRVADFEIEDLRITIGQDVSLPILIPIALQNLRQNILAEGHFYEGDLLKNVLASDKIFWNENPLLKKEIIAIVEDNMKLLESFDTTDDIRNAIFEAYEELKK
jgi:hypothetical protein